MNPLMKLWFWLLILSILGILIALISFEAVGQTNSQNTSTPIWIWVVFGLGFLFWVIALILYALDVAAYNKKMIIAEACGELPPPPAKKKIECPKKDCVQKPPCDVKVVPTVDVQHNQNEAFSAAGFKPLSSLAPVPK